jgi:DNA mismatch repair protein MutL
MSRIHQLDEHTANKIAAGEVIERPANVIKETVENAIDAKATKIDIEVVEGGSEMMRITDNGIGMDHEDALMCFSRHATSKINDGSDLFNITTLGFRGEAIPSIASISLFTLESDDGSGGTRVVYEFGKRKEVEACALNKGTRITVEKIFQNVPARLKYMKSVNAEFAAIYTYIERLSLAHPEIAFSLTHNGKLIYTTNGSGKLLEVIASIYSIQTAKEMIPINFGNDEFQISGYTSKSTLSRASKNHIITSVNHRYVRHMKTINTINDVYRAYLPERRFPITIINIDVDPYLVDVNVHPAKLEVRFSQESLLKQLITDGFEEALRPKMVVQEEKKEKTPIPSFSRKKVAEQIHFNLDDDVPTLIKTPVSLPKSKPQESEIIEPVEKEEEEPNVLKGTTQTEVQEERPAYTMAKEPENQPVKKARLRPIKEKIYVKTQLRGSYIVGENEKGIYLIDQYRASRQIAYEKYKEKFAQGVNQKAALAVPLMFELQESECLILEEKKDALVALGIELSPFSKNTYALRSLPVWMQGVDEQAFVEEMINVLIHQDEEDLIALRDAAIASLSSKAVTKNTHLSMIEMQALVDDLMRCEDAYRDASGHTIIVFNSDYELNKLFKKG